MIVNISKDVPKIGSKIILSQKSKYGADLLRENGKIWIVLEYRANVLAFSNKPGIRIESVLTQNWRWVGFPEDKDFYWTTVMSFQA